MKRYRTESGVGAHDSNRIVYRVRNNAWVKVNRVLPDLTPEQLALFLGQCESVLDGRELAVLQYRNGLIGGREHTLEEVAAHFSVTRERIRQIENKALRKLKHHLKHMVT